MREPSIWREPGGSSWKVGDDLQLALEVGSRLDEHFHARIRMMRS